jgi:hypothetical protein
MLLMSWERLMVVRLVLERYSCNWISVESGRQNINSYLDERGIFVYQCRLDKDSRMKHADLSVQNTQIRRRNVEWKFYLKYILT